MYTFKLTNYDGEKQYNDNEFTSYLHNNTPSLSKFDFNLGDGRYVSGWLCHPDNILA